VTESSLIAPRRQLFQWTLAFCWFGIPFVRFGGQGLVEIDLVTQTLHLAGATFRIEELLLFLLLLLGGIFFFLLITMVLGRVWCGWVCPQTAFVDLAEAVARRLGLTVRHFRLSGPTGPRLLLVLFLAVFALSAGASFVWYFVPPYEYFARLGRGELGSWPLGTTLVLAGLIFVDLLLLRRIFCRDFCPYGRFQTVLVHPGTLILRELPEEAERCLDCRACLRACPMEIDIRNGYQVECINCARCLDACRQVMAPCGEPGIIGYTFGYGGRGWRALLDTRLLAIALILAGLLGGLIFFAAHRAPVSFKVSRPAEARSLVRPDGRLVTVFTGFLRNRADRELPVRITATLEDGTKLSVTGPTELILHEDDNRRVQLAVATPVPAGKPLTVIFTISDRNGRKLLASRAYIPQSAAGENERH
jgi:cytochrome c oxidase accessory protein FixG